MSKKLYITILPLMIFTLTMGGCQSDIKEPRTCRKSKMTCEEALKIDQPAIGTGSLIMKCKHLRNGIYIDDVFTNDYCSCGFYSSRHIGWDGEYTYSPDIYDKENLEEVMNFIIKESFYIEVECE